MTVTLRPHQVDACNGADSMFLNGAKNVLMVLPTGSGKTLVKAEYARRAYVNNEIAIAFAHRDVLLSQISDAFCMMGVPHKFICADKTRRDITNANLTKYGNSFYDDRSPIIIASVPTYRARLNKGRIDIFFRHSVKWWFLDESHHLTIGSTWGDSVESLPNARGLGVTATPIRGDKKGLGRHADGVFDDMFVGDSMWDLIKSGRLAPYKIFTPPTNLDLSKVTVTAGGDYNQKKLNVAVDKREITGSAVEHYKHVLNGQRVITFGVSIEHCKHIANEFNQAGIPSKAVSSNNTIDERNQALDDLKSGLILNLVNCDLFSEGFDAPAVAGVIMLRPTQSYSLYKQQFGRCLRPSEGKSHGILLDHVGNTQYMMNRFGLAQPHDDPHWTLDRQSKRKKTDDGEKLDKTAICPECAAFYVIPDGGERICPDCGHSETIDEAETRIRELQVNEGQLVEMSIDAVDNIIKERARVDTPIDVFARKMVNAPSVVRHSAVNNHTKRFNAQIVLRDKIQRWCMNHAQLTGFSIETVQGEFSRLHGVNIFKAQTLSEREAINLANRIAL